MGRRSLGAWAIERSVGVVLVLLLVPLFTLIVWLHAHDRWAPVADLALTEMHVRSVGTTHTPLVGLLGRLGRLQNASHPGPLGFYLLAPLYRLLGSSYFALRVSTATLNAAAIVSALLIARRALARERRFILEAAGPARARPARSGRLVARDRVDRV